ncbi:high-affinity branched-chain amino acid ABC transporter permease LivM [Sneathiella litorea]|uniref:High-affinity branched-chain amino acid ABC transporter permease LivM n=1 Tax=Sneathiella litorea TaxID=2606216 RepID=A0A6L8W2W7_9PROT|nr:high-affinity branched-chain amino acid ABC transporter permease LivM [Sneathiella litorea]MZR29406.1 high-affinity branched-chain amino acid ABC transporter permease LivM [Sneathiella litorea]
MADTESTPSRPARHLDFSKVVKDLIVTTLIATAVFGSTIAFRTVSAAGGLGLEVRYDIAFYVIAAVVIGRLLLWIFVWSKPPGTSAVEMPVSIKSGLAKVSAKVGKGFGPTMLLFALVFPFLPFTDRYLLDLSILILTYVMLGWGLNIVVGLAGLLDLGYVAFYAIGAYSYALLAQYFGFSFWMCLPLAGILAAFWGIILGFPVLRLRGDYLAIVTLAFGEIIRIVLLNWYQFTGGPDGLSGIPRPSFFGLPFNRSEGGFADFFGLDYSSIHRIMFLYFLILALALLTNFVTNRLRRLPIGRAWEALREDEIACRSLGLNTTSVKLTAFAIGAMFAGFAGSFFATRQGFISPESFTFIESALILAIVVLGGMGSQTGVVIASIAMIGGFEIFREAEQFRMLIFGLAMVIIMIWRPRGLISTRIPSIFLKEKKKVSADMVAQGEGH